jgi:hypothetical protein
MGCNYLMTGKILYIRALALPQAIDHELYITLTMQQ